MTPTFSLAILCLVVAFFTLWQWNNRAGRFSEPSSVGRKIGWHLIACLAMAGGVWLVNCLWWSLWTDQGAMLMLLLVEGLVAGGISAGLLYGAAVLDSPQSKNETEPGLSPGTEGVVHLRRFSQTRGILSSGVMVIWNEQRGCWTSLEAVKEDERNPLAS